MVPTMVIPELQKLWRGFDQLDERKIQRWQKEPSIRGVSCECACKDVGGEVYVYCTQ